MNLEEARKLAASAQGIHYRPRKPSDISTAGIRAQRLAEVVLELADEVEQLEAKLAHSKQHAANVMAGWKAYHDALEEYRTLGDR